MKRKLDFKEKERLRKKKERKKKKNERKEIKKYNK